MPDWPRTRRVLEDGRQQSWHHGVQLFVSRHGTCLANLAFGDNTPGQPMTTELLMLWRSSTKPVVAMAVALLVDRNLVQLESSVADWISEFAQHGKEDIQLRHLLTHTAGLRSADLQLREGMTWEESIATICQARPEPRTAPGEQAGYHLGSTWFLLGELIRRIDPSRRHCRQFVRDELFLPLGMNDSWIGMDQDQFPSYEDRIGMMHTLKNGELQAHPDWNTMESCARCQPGSHGRGPIRELAKFYEFLLDARRGRIAPKNHSGLLAIGGDTVRRWTSRQRVGMYDQTFRHKMDWGFGFIINSNRYGADTVPYGYGKHASEETFGHSGAQSSCAFADPEQDLVVAWVCNGMPGEADHQRRARALNQAIYEDLQLVRNR